MKYLTIKEFSKHTGLPPSKLRFYDKKELLQPSMRLDNGYRAYSFDQIHLAKMIDSLRQADIAIEEIKHYIGADERGKKLLLENWRRELDKKLEVIQAARTFVGGMKTESSHHLLLSKWERKKFFVWQRFEVKKQPHPFQKCFQLAFERLQDRGINCSKNVYVRTEKITKDKIIGEIGFEMQEYVEGIKDEMVRYEEIPPTLFAILQDCRADDEFLCFSYIQMVIRYGFQPAGTKIERYASLQTDSFDYLIPLVK